MRVARGRETLLMSADDCDDDDDEAKIIFKAINFASFHIKIENFVDWKSFSFKIRSTVRKVLAQELFKNLRIYLC